MRLRLGGNAAGIMILVLADFMLVKAQEPVQKMLAPPPPPICPRVAEMVASHHQPVAVPPGLEIEVLDPNVDPQGNPTVLTRPAAVTSSFGHDGQLQVDIPPTVLVHRYYYTGDRSFQARLLPGGPCIVVVSHPKTGERLYIPVQLPPGAPRVTYTDSSIEYDYGTQAVTISFCCLLHCSPKVTYRQGITVKEKVEHCAVCARDATRRLVNRTGIPECADKAAAGTKSAVVTTVDRVNDLGKKLLAPPIALIRATPLSNLLNESPEVRAEKDRAAEVKRAADRASQADSFINTNR